MIEWLTKRRPMQAQHWGMVAGGALIVGITNLATPVITPWLIAGNALFFTGLGRVLLAVASK